MFRKVVVSVGYPLPENPTAKIGSNAPRNYLPRTWSKLFLVALDAIKAWLRLPFYKLRRRKKTAQKQALCAL
jgi:hypothetical protein